MKKVSKPAFDYRHGVTLGMAMIGGVGIGTALYKYMQDPQVQSEQRKEDLKNGAVAGLSLLTLFVVSKFSWGDWFTFEGVMTKTEKAATEAIEEALQ